eukprot:COSAG02_NODE_23799_length_707_cov_3.225329_1_plen_80_part_01
MRLAASSALLLALPARSAATIVNRGDGVEQQPLPFSHSRRLQYAPDSNCACPILEAYTPLASEFGYSEDDAITAVSATVT